MAFGNLDEKSRAGEAATIQDFAVSNESSKKIVGRELAAGVAALLLYPIGMRSRAVRTKRRAAQRTVVLVHGYLANPSCFLPLKAYLRMRGIRSVSYQYGMSDSIDGAAIGLKAFLRKNVRGGRIDLVCHSLGGLVARVYLQDLGGARRVAHCITLGTPHRGTYNAYWVPSRIGSALRPDSRLLARLAATQENARTVRFFSIVAGSDNIVIPRVFAMAEADMLHVPDVGHLGMLFSKRVFRAIYERLAERERPAG